MNTPCSAYPVDSEWLAGLARLYSSPCHFSPDRLASYYDADALFTDPVHEVRGLAAMSAYFRRAYANLDYCRFVFARHAQAGEQLFISWDMHFSHPALQHGRRITVAGCSHLQLQGRVIRTHRDYYDVGQMLYDHVPLLGRVTGWLKGRLVPDTHGATGRTVKVNV